MVFTESCLSRNLPFWLVRCLADSKHLFQGCEYSRWVSFSTVEHVCLYGWTIVQSDFGVSSDHLCDRCLCARRWPLAAWCDVTRSIMIDMWRHENASLCFSVTRTFGPWRHLWRHPIFDHEWLSSVMRAYLGARPYGRTDSICETRVNQCSTRLTTLSYLRHSVFDCIDCSWYLNKFINLNM